MEMKPTNVYAALATFDEVYSPRIVTRMNDYDVRIAHTLGEHLWHVHTDTDEFFLVLEGQFDVAVRDGDGVESTVVLHKGDTFVVPKGTEHKPSSPGGSILMFEPSGNGHHRRPARGRDPRPRRQHRRARPLGRPLDNEVDRRGWSATTGATRSRFIPEGYELRTDPSSTHTRRGEAAAHRR